MNFSNLSQDWLGTLESDIKSQFSLDVTALEHMYLLK